MGLAVEAVQVSTPLHLAAAAGKLGRVEALLTRRVVLAPRDAGGRTPLACAVAGGHGAVVRALIDAGADPDGTDGRGVPLLLGAPASMQAVLLDAGADPEVEDGEGNGVWAWARSEEAVAALRARVPPPTPVQAVRVLRGACHRPALLRCLLEAGVPVEVPVDAAGTSPLTPMHHAARWGADESLRLLLAAGADPAPRLAEALVDGARVFAAGSTPWDLASAERRALLPAQRAGSPLSIPVVLLEVGPDPDAVAWVIGNHRAIADPPQAGEVAWEAPTRGEAEQLKDTLRRAGARAALGLCDDGDRQEEPHGRS